MRLIVIFAGLLALAPLSAGAAIITLDENNLSGTVPNKLGLPIAVQFNSTAIVPPGGPFPDIKVNDSVPDPQNPGSSLPARFFEFDADSPAGIFFSTNAAPQPSSVGNHRNPALGEIPFRAATVELELYLGVNGQGGEQNDNLDITNLTISLLDAQSGDIDPVFMMLVDDILNIDDGGFGNNTPDVRFLLPLNLLAGIPTLDITDRLVISYTAAGNTSGIDFLGIDPEGAPLDPNGLESIPLPAPVFLLLGSLGLLGWRARRA